MKTQDKDEYLTGTQILMDPGMTRGQEGKSKTDHMLMLYALNVER